MRVRRTRVRHHEEPRLTDHLRLSTEHWLARAFHSEQEKRSERGQTMEARDPRLVPLQLLDQPRRPFLELCRTQLRCVRRRTLHHIGDAEAEAHEFGVVLRRELIYLQPTPHALTQARRRKS